MRRFEFVEGTSAKFWSAEVEGSAFVVVFGRLGTAGQRKEKAFPTPEAARKEYDKKVAEKLREGYHEVASDAGAQVAPGAKGAAAASEPLHLPARLRPHQPTPDQVRAAVVAVTSLEGALGSRSWVVERAAQRAWRALRRVSNSGPLAPELHAALDRVLATVAAPQAQLRLPLRHALGLLAQLEAPAFGRAVRETWSGLSSAHPASDAVAALAHQLEALGDDELALRVSQALVGSHSPKRWAELAPHLQAYLVRRHSSVKAHLTAAAATHPQLAARTQQLLAS